MGLKSLIAFAACALTVVATAYAASPAKKFHKGPPPPLQCYGAEAETHGHALIITPALGHKLSLKDRKFMSALASPDPVQYSQAVTYFKKAQNHQIFDAKIDAQETLAGFASLRQFVKIKKFTDPVHLRLATLVDKSDTRTPSQDADPTTTSVEDLDKQDLRSFKGKFLSRWNSKNTGDDEAVFFQLEFSKKTVIVGLQLHDGTQDCLTLTSNGHRHILPEGADKTMIPENYPFRSPVSAPFIVSYFYGPRIFNSMNLSLGLERSEHDKPVALPPSKGSPMEYLNKFWQFHTGVDFSVSSGTSIYAPFDGAVFALGKMGCAGNTMVLAHSIPGNERVVFTVYEHLKDFGKIAVAQDGMIRPRKGQAMSRRGEHSRELKIGDAVAQGQLIAHSGRSGTKVGFGHGFKEGCVDGAHLHFEVRIPKDINIALSRQVASVEDGRKIGESGKRFRFVETETIAINPADFVPGIDEACQVRKKAEIKNVIELRKSNYKKVPPLTAGLCSYKFEISLTEVPSLYRLTRTTNLMQDDDGLPGKLTASEAPIKRR